MLKRNGKIGRRDLFKTSAGILGGALLSREAAAEQAAQRNVNTNSIPSALKITDLRVATVVKPGPSPCPIVRLDTNQGVYGGGTGWRASTNRLSTKGGSKFQTSPVSASP
jgi:hypothetical protein